ncbi:MAG: hypothetical protein LUC88_11180 [Prevotella sp.]|nr:hypothetical protein [Prevotella sp.]
MHEGVNIRFCETSGQNKFYPYTWVHEGVNIRFYETSGQNKLPMVKFLTLNNSNEFDCIRSIGTFYPYIG